MRFHHLLLHPIKMKKEASDFFKAIFNALRALAKAKSMSLKSRTSALKTRLIIFSLLRNKKVLLGSLSDKLHSLLHPNITININHKDQDHTISNNDDKAIVVYQNDSRPAEHIITCTDLVGPVREVDDHLPQCYQFEDVDADHDDNTYPDWTHSMFDSSDDGDDDEKQGYCSSVIDLVRNAKDKEGEEFRLEDEIDHVADMFIRRFHRQIRLEKQQSLKRFQEMLQRSV